MSNRLFVSRIHATFHAWELTSFRTEELRAETRKAVSVSLHKLYPDAVISVSFDEEPIKAVGVGLRAEGGSKQQQDAVIELESARIGHILRHIIRQYVIADATLRNRQKEAGKASGAGEHAAYQPAKPFPYDGRRLFSG